MKTESKEPWRIESVSHRLADEYNDIFDAEYGCDYTTASRYGVEFPQERGELRYCFDEAQALEVLAMDPGWFYGEMFYMINSPGFEGEDEHCYVQDFGFGPYLREPEPLFWMSIIEDQPDVPKERGDLLSPDFFLTMKASVIEFLSKKHERRGP